MYILLCEFCGWKLITEGTEFIDLVKYKSPPRVAKAQKNGYKCPDCGRIIFARKTSDPQQELDDNNEIGQRRDEGEENLLSQDWLDRT
jgi:DNA-directed RNA polymerase subunit RPC12/RpoP